MHRTPKQSNGNYYKNNRVQLVNGGKEYFSLLEQLIDAAIHSVHIQTYIFNIDETGNTIAAALIKAAKRGIPVYLLVVGYASRHIPVALIARMKNAGINFRFFEPILKSNYFYFGRRLHHKVVVIDAQFALVGGLNIANRYNDLPNSRAWLDMAIMVEGEAAAELYHYCYSLWSKEKEPTTLPPYYEKLHHLIPYNEKCSVRVRRNDWIKAKREIWKTYFCLFNNAMESITIMCSYFLPGQELRKALSKAVKRGVKVRIILAGPSDVVFVKHAERYLYNWLLRHHIEIYEYQPTILHAKMAVVDHHWVTIGSYNINNISAYASIELNLDIRNKPFANHVQNELDQIIINDCIRIKHPNNNVTFPGTLLQRLSYELIRLLLYLFTFYFKQEE
ncbi:phospholipase D-like domain-containing protein [Chitinophagaceae bacterium LB-8]|uniref:Phospholipase D-like domain-containing protein n=1 Tax=Paraflavisolibacter caeni TaxID=2982496 RepID=A0A9X3BGV4_9BACT|nr:phospholipase D-like domain-containing protein [Paraflavisolibacter caeni]MCU7551559.1 phospholipase D-like domain-containing protein [Paraflavisolibacter caeni]